MSNRVTESIWAPNWKERCLDRIRSMGFSSATELLRNMEGVPYSEVAPIVGQCVPAQLLMLQFEEALDENSLRWALADSLVREIREGVPNGWSQGTQKLSPESAQLVTLSGWSSSLRTLCGRPEIAVNARNVLPFLRAHAPDRWIPADTNDPIIVAAIDKLFNASPPDELADDSQSR